MRETLQERADRIRQWLADHVDGLKAVRRERDEALAELRQLSAEYRWRYALLGLAEKRVKARIDETEKEICRLQKLNRRRWAAITDHIDEQRLPLSDDIHHVEHARKGEVRAKYKASIAGLHDGRARRYRRDLEKLTRRIAAKHERAKRPPMDPGDIALGKLPEDMTSRLEPKPVVIDALSVVAAAAAKKRR